MAKQKDDHVVIALFKDEDAAKAGEKTVKKWDKSDKDVKLGNVGMIYTSTLAKKDARLKSLLV